MEMSKGESASYRGIMGRRYAAARRKGVRELVLDEFCKVTGLTRKHAIKALSPKRRGVRRAGAAVEAFGHDVRRAKAACPNRGRRRQSSLEEHRREIPLMVDLWPEAYPKEPGCVKVDTVAHCGGSMRGASSGR